MLTNISEWTEDQASLGQEQESGAAVAVGQAGAVRPVQCLLCFPVGCVRAQGGIAVAAS